MPRSMALSFICRGVWPMPGSGAAVVVDAFFQRRLDLTHEQLELAQDTRLDNRFRETINHA